MWYTYTVEYYSALKKKESLTHATKWINFEDIMLSEISQSQNDKKKTTTDKYCMIPLIWSKYSKVCRDKEEMVIVRGWRGGENRVLFFNRYRVSVFKDEQNSRNGWWSGIYLFQYCLWELNEHRLWSDL